MNKTIVFYKSKFGTSKDYAYWISNTIDCQVFDYSNVTIDKLLQYDTIILGGDLYTNGINGVSMITRNFKKLKDKKIIIFTAGLSSSNNPDFFYPSLDMLFSKEMQEKIIFFHFPLSINNPSLGYLNIKGSDLALVRFDQEKKEVSIKGNIDAISYLSNKRTTKSKDSVLNKLLK